MENALRRPFSIGDYENMSNVRAVRAGADVKKKADELLDMAMDAIERGADQAEAISSLKSLDITVKEADVALGLLRLGYFPFELRDANTAWRYLVAVKHLSALPVLTMEESHRIDQIEALARLERERAYEQLLQIEPRLQQIRQRVVEQSDSWDTRGASNNGFFLIEEMLTECLGPDSNQSDSVLNSSYAFHIARRMYLIGVAGLLDRR
jgi:hypothetical protein